MSIINLFTTVNNLVLKRVNAANTIVKGVYQTVARTSTFFTGSVQPMPKEMLLNLTEGQRSRDPKVIFTKTLLHTADKAAQRGADFVTYNGKDYEVIAVTAYPDWNGNDLSHYEVSILRKDD